MVAMRIDAGSYGDVPLTGLKWAAAVWWPGRIDEGNGHLQLTAGVNVGDELLYTESAGIPSYSRPGPRLARAPPRAGST
jgi:hypothetical protein